MSEILPKGWCPDCKGTSVIMTSYYNGPCLSCNGTGNKCGNNHVVLQDDEHDCPTCHGTGAVTSIQSNKEAVTTQAPSDVTLCRSCYCATKTIAGPGRCAKCKALKSITKPKLDNTKGVQDMSEDGLKPSILTELELPPALAEFERNMSVIIDHIRFDEDRILRAGELAYPEQLTAACARAIVAVLTKLLDQNMEIVDPLIHGEPGWVVRKSVLDAELARYRLAAGMEVDK